ncbi:hypothetical protein IMZ48_26940 [Candidatus Bathyarchaeota archaeon]|nr:hypothetical protein [Candidatus Bathyarchaeota archaeon]
MFPCPREGRVLMVLGRPPRDPYVIPKRQDEQACRDDCVALPSTVARVAITNYSLAFPAIYGYVHLLLASPGVEPCRVSARQRCFASSSTLTSPSCYRPPPRRTGRGDCRPGGASSHPPVSPAASASSAGRTWSANHVRKPPSVHRASSRSTPSSLYRSTTLDVFPMLNLPAV